MTDAPMPIAEVELPSRRSLAWLLPAVALALAAFLLVDVMGGRGILIVVHAEEGYGIEAGDALRYRGIDVGEIEEALLAADLSNVELRVRLEPGAEAIAKAGSRFWIVRPRLSLDSVQGLETVVGARHLEVDPGDAGGQRQTEFVALTDRPVVERQAGGGLELALEAPSRYGLQAGAPVTYRQLSIGSVLSVGLASDATSVEFRVWIRPEFVQLVRTDSVFWETGGVELGLSFTEGLSLDVGTLRSLLVGGIALATPTDPGGLVSTGHRFSLHPKAEDRWLEWSPPLAVGGELLPVEARPPRLLRASHSWRQGRILKSDKERTGWVLAVPGGILGPADLLVAEPKAIEGSAMLEVAGRRIALDSPPAWSERGLTRRSVELEGTEPFDLESTRALPEEPEEALVLADAGTAPMALAVSRLRAGARGWEVDEAVAFDATWNGAAVLARSDGALLGILLVGESGARVAPVPLD